jgi:hypothetical protein
MQHLVKLVGVKLPGLGILRGPAGLHNMDNLLHVRLIGQFTA